MARFPRIQFPGAFYHVIGRGNQRQEIFLDEKDKQAFLERIQRYKEETEFVLYAYVLMPNHFYLLMGAVDVPLSKIMQLTNLTYTQYFNRKYNEVGPVFQGRYKAVLCERDEYLLNLVRYIYPNPVRAGLVKRPSFKKILLAVQRVTGVSEEEIVSSGRKQETVFAKSILAGVWREHGYRLVDLQPKLGRDISVLSRLSRISNFPNGMVIKSRIRKMSDA
jgi:REP element-mobilizing transposase RayT